MLLLKILRLLYKTNVITQPFLANYSFRINCEMWVTIYRYTLEIFLNYFTIDKNYFS